MRRDETRQVACVPEKRNTLAAPFSARQLRQMDVASQHGIEMRYENLSHIITGREAPTTGRRILANRSRVFRQMTLWSASILVCIIRFEGRVLSIIQCQASQRLFIGIRRRLTKTRYSACWHPFPTVRPMGRTLFLGGTARWGSPGCRPHCGNVRRCNRCTTSQTVSGWSAT